MSVLIPAQANEVIVGEAVKAILDGELRTAHLDNEAQITGIVWEIYRSIQTPSVRIRMSDESGRVHHFNTLRCLELVRA